MLHNAHSLSLSVYIFVLLLLYAEGLTRCWKLVVLAADNNLLVSCCAPEDLPNLQTLSCASNQLLSPPNVCECSLLTNLQLQHNNLQEVHEPHVLLPLHY